MQLNVHKGALMLRSRRQLISYSFFDSLSDHNCMGCGNNHVPTYCDMAMLSSIVYRWRAKEEKDFICCIDLWGTRCKEVLASASVSAALIHALLSFYGINGTFMLASILLFTWYACYFLQNIINILFFHEYREFSHKISKFYALKLIVFPMILIKLQSKLDFHI